VEKQIRPTIRTPLIRSVFCGPLLLAVCVTPFALAQRNTTEQSATAQMHAANKPAISANPDAVLPVTGQPTAPQ